MATPLTDFCSRLRGAGLTEPQAEAISAGFEVLDRKIDAVERRLTEKIDGAERRLAERIDAVERRLDRVEWWQRAQSLLLGLILAAVRAPYVGALFGLPAGG